MKKLLFIFPILLSVLFLSCSDEDNNTNDKVKVSVFCMKNVDGVDTPLQGTIYFFKVAEYPKGWDYNRKNHTFTLKDGTILRSDYSLTMLESGSQEGYLDANSLYMHVWEPSDSETVYGIENLETKNKPVTIYKKYGYVP